VCVATSQGGPIELIKHGETGFLVDPGNYDDFSNTMTKVLTMSREERNMIGDRARKFLRDQFSLGHYIAHLKALYQKPHGKN
jgi:glycosyltransferase involved in cell wall biosynthesis